MPITESRRRSLEQLLAGSKCHVQALELKAKGQRATQADRDAAAKARQEFIESVNRFHTECRRKIPGYVPSSQLDLEFSGSPIIRARRHA